MPASAMMTQFAHRKRASGYVERDWSAEPFTRGAYAALFPPGAWTQYGPALRNPAGRIHWAGSETASRWYGYIDGAIRSGEAAAIVAAAALDATGSIPGPQAKSHSEAVDEPGME
jgi:monoamine oxidase